MNKSTNSGSAATGKITLRNGPIYRGEVWLANGLTFVRLPDGRVRGFGPEAIYSIELPPAVER